MAGTGDILQVDGGRRWRGVLELTVPGDKSITHRAWMLGGLAPGESCLEGVLEAGDCQATRAAMEQLGAVVTPAGTPGAYAVRGVGGRPGAPASVIDCGNSGTAMRLLAGVLAGQPFRSVLDGDSSLRRRPMRRIAEPLERMGARVEFIATPGCAPLAVTGGRLAGIDYASAKASAQVKSCVLLAGLFAEGATIVREPYLSRDHTERMLRALGVALESEGGVHRLRGGWRELRPGRLRVPGDLSSAAFWMVAAAARPGAEVRISRVGVNPTRTGLIDVLRRMGAEIEVAPVADPAYGSEPVGDIVVRGVALRGTQIGGAEIPRLIDEVPILAVAAALALGETVIRDAAELRVKESDRLAAMARGLGAMGAQVDELPDGLRIAGGGGLHGAELDSGQDHRIAMAFLVAGLFAKGTTTMRGCAYIDTSYPGFREDLARAAS